MSETNKTDQLNTRINRDETTKPNIYKPPARAVSINRKSLKQSASNENLQKKPSKEITDPFTHNLSTNKPSFSRSPEANKRNLKPLDPIDFLQVDRDSINSFKQQNEYNRTRNERSPVKGLSTTSTENFGHQIGKNMHSHNDSFGKGLNTSLSKDFSTLSTSTLSSMTHRQNMSFLEKNFENMSVNRNSSLYGSFYENDYVNQESSTINLEDLMILEEKLVDIITDLNSHLKMTNQCFEWWNYFFNCSLCGKFQEYFKDEKQKQIIKDFENLELLSVIICYDISFTPKLLENISHLIKSILEVAHRNYLILCDYIVSKVSSDSLSNIWVIRLRNLLNLKLPFKFKKGQHIGEIMGGNDTMYDYIRIVLKNSPENEVNDTLVAFFKNITKINTSVLNDFYRQKVLRVANKNASVIASVVLESGDKQEAMPYPYIKKEPKKEFTLVLDLDETLIHFKADDDESKGILRLRPGLYDFLESMKQHYEMVIFTASTQEVIFN
jgi:hypothetical protein